MTPERTGGAGIGNLRKENNTPTIKPAAIASSTSFIEPPI
jgi:hypothetical protein